MGWDELFLQWDGMGRTFFDNGMGWDETVGQWDGTGWDEKSFWDGTIPLVFFIKLWDRPI